MRLSSTVESALHICVILATLDADDMLAVRDLAAFHELAPASLAKQLQTLNAAGIVEGSAGRTGGYRLARPPISITVLDVVVAIEGPQPMFRCLEVRRNGPCTGPDRTYSPTCAIAQVMAEAEDAWRATLAAYTLADLGRTIATDLDPTTATETIAWISSNRRSPK